MLRSRSELHAPYPYEDNQLQRSIAMSTSERSFQDQRGRRLLVTAALASLGFGAAAYGIHSRPALAEPARASLSRAETPMTPQSVQPRAASADADFGPGNAEPILVGSH